MKWFSAIVLVLFMGLLVYATGGLPPIGDPDAPANQHVSPDYIERSVEDTEVPNVVTSVLADYRGYDTLGETTVIFTAGLACVLALMKRMAND